MGCGSQNVDLPKFVRADVSGTGPIADAQKSCRLSIQPRACPECLLTVTFNEHEIEEMPRCCAVYQKYSWFCYNIIYPLSIVVSSIIKSAIAAPCSPGLPKTPFIFEYLAQITPRLLCKSLFQNILLTKLHGVTRQQQPRSLPIF